MGDRYVEFAIGAHTNRGSVCTLTQFKDLAVRARLLGKPIYRSLYEFDESVVQHFRMFKTIKGYEGMHHLVSLVLDIDRGKTKDEDINILAHDIYRDCSSKFPWFEHACNIWYSGTGYHFVLPNVFKFQGSNDLHEVVKLTMAKHFPFADAIYDKSRLIRANYSLNEKEGRYKIPISKQLWKYADAEWVIRDASKVPETTDPTDTFEYFDTPMETQIVYRPMVYNPEIRPKTETNGLVTCVQKMFAEGETPGSRHQKALRVASAWRRQGIPEVGVVAMIQTYIPSFSFAECQRLVRDVFKGDYRYGCDDVHMSAYCDSKCLFYKEKNFNSSILSAHATEANFRKFVLSDAEARAFDLKTFYNLPHSYKFYPGELVVLIGDTKLGKSAWMQNLVVKATDKRVLYLSLEVNEALIYRRFIQIAHSLSKSQVIEYYKKNTNTLSKAISHIAIGCTSPNLEDIPRLITEMDIDITVVDVIDMLRVTGIKGGDQLAQLDTVARRLKEIANKTSSIIFGIHHLSKSSAQDEQGKSRALTVHSGKSSSSLEQKADKILGIEGNPLNDKRVVRSLGSRDETNFKINYQVDWNTFTFHQQEGVV